LINANPKSFASCGIIGAGKLASVLALALGKAGLLNWIVARNQVSRKAIEKLCGNETELLQSIEAINHLPELIIIAVNDSAIEEVSRNIAKCFAHKLKNIHIIHLSGSKSIDTLNDCEECGAYVSSLHPFQTFFVSDLNALKNIAWGMEFNHSQSELLENFITTLGGIPFKLPNQVLEKKALYHLSAVAASNIATSVFSYAKLIAEKAGIEPNLFFPQIMKRTLENFLQLGLNQAEMPLTGPYARSDTDVINSHIEHLSNFPELLDIYRDLARATAKLANLQGILSNDKLYLVLQTINQSTQIKK
jgi:predicted short-subunit dehydrogenase-like oxidoreductase (DUF2520 family)